MKKQVENLTVDDFVGFSNDKYSGFRLYWSANIGFGEMTFAKVKETDIWEVETECMSDNKDKTFITQVLNKFVDSLEVIE